MSRTIADLAIGTGVYVDETVNGVTTHEEYIYLGIDEYGKARVLRKYAPQSKRMHSSNVASYAGCEMDAWLENTTDGWASRYSAAFLNCLENTTIKYVDFNDTTETAGVVKTIARRIFLLSYTEMGFSAAPAGSEGVSFLQALKTYYGVTGDNAARITRQANDSAVNSWLRSGSSAAQFRYVNTNGSAFSNNATSTSSWPRPALSVAPATSVSDEGADYISILPDGSRTIWPVSAHMSLGKTVKRPKLCKLMVPADQFQTLNLKVCNNYGDATPTWVDCLNGGVAAMGFDKTANDWELGVKIDAEATEINRKIGEPAMIVEFDDD